MMTSGLLYMVYRYSGAHHVESFQIFSLKTVALWHVAGAFVVVAFVIAHLYLITTGQTPTSNLKAMITGFEDIEGHEQ